MKRKIINRKKNEGRFHFAKADNFGEDKRIREKNKRIRGYEPKKRKRNREII